MELQEKTKTILPSITHSIKIEETAKGIRFQIHVYGIGVEETDLDALKTYENTVDMFKKKGHVIAPMNLNINGARHD